MSIDDLSSSFVAFSLDTLEGDRTFNNCDGNQEAYLQHSQNGEVLFRGTACSSQDSFLSKTSLMSLNSLDPTARIRSVDLLLTWFFANSMDSCAVPPTVVFEATPSCSNSIRGGDVDPNDFEPPHANHGGNEVYDESVGALLQETELIPAASDTARLEEAVSASPDSVAARTTTQDSSVVMTAKDVLAERGGFANNHPGNKAASDTARLEDTISASPDSVAARTTTEESSVVMTAKHVLAERGGFANNHPGNKAYVEYCRGKEKEYKKLGNRSLKKDMTKDTMEKFRFLRRDNKDSHIWYPLSEKDAKEKVSRSLRGDDRCKKV